MPQSRYQAAGSAIEAERQLKYQGTARINLDVIRFERNLPGKVDRDHVEHLKRCFRNEGCQRQPARNHVPVLISQRQLAGAIRDSGVSRQQLFAGQQHGYPRLEFPTGLQLECLHGRHRIQAGREFLLPTEKWWIVDLYLPDLDPNLRSWLLEEYSHEQRPSDGEIYQKLRQYDTEKNLSSKLRWKSRLRGIRAKSLNTLYKHEDLTHAFDALLVIPGLWDGMKLSTIHKLFPLRCNEEIVHYLRHIKSVWSGLVRGSDEAMSRIDPITVRALQMRAPRASTTDAKMLRSQLRAGEIFSHFNDSEREDIWSRLQMIEGLIPSLHTLFRDVGYLEHCVNCVKRLTALSPQHTLSQAMKGRFTGVNQRRGQLKVQVREDKFVYRPGTPEDQIDFGYRQIFAFAMRHWPDMPKEPEKEDPQMRAPTKADTTTLRRFADLATELGFKSDQITDLQHYTRREEEGPAEHHHSNPILVTSGKGVPVKKRCGKPSTREFMEDQHCLFVNHLHDESQEQESSITSFFVRKSVYLAFFGKPPATSSHISTDETPLGPRPQSLDGSPQGSRRDVSTHSPVDNANQSRHSSQHSIDSIDSYAEIFTFYQQEDATSEQRATPNITEEASDDGAAERGEERSDVDSIYDLSAEEEELVQGIPEEERLELERLELKKTQERLEREDLQNKLAQKSQAQRTADEEKLREQERKRHDQEMQEEEQRRQETRHRQRREEEARVHGRTHKPLQRTESQHTQLDMEGIVTNRELVVADQSHMPDDPGTPVTDQSEGQPDRLEQERVEPEAPEESRLEPESLQEEGRERDSPEPESHEQERREQESREQERRDKEKREQEKREQEKREQERSEQEGVELRRIEKEVEREDLQERLAEALQVHGSLERVKQRQQEVEKEEREMQDEAGRRRQIREQSRLEQEKMVRDDAERTRKRRTEIDMESVLAKAGENQGAFTQTGDSRQLGRELVAIEPSTDPPGDPSVGGQQERQATSDEEELEREKRNQEKREQDRLQRKMLNDRFARKSRQHEVSRKENLEFEQRAKDQQEKERHELDNREAVRQQKDGRQQQRLEHEKTIESEETPEPVEVHRKPPTETARPRRRQNQPPQAQTPHSVWITFKIRERGVWRTTERVYVDPSDPSEVERLAGKYVRKREPIGVYDTDLNLLNPRSCFEAAIADGSNLLLLIPGNGREINEELEASVSRLLSESDDTDIE